MSFVVFGESLVDIASGPTITATSTPGGSPMNVAVGLSRLDQDVTLVTHLGDDAAGHKILNYLRHNGVAVVADAESDFPTSVARASIQTDGSASYDFGITWDIAGILAEAAQRVAGALAVHCGSIATHLHPGSEEVYQHFRNARSHALTSYDPNCRPSIIGSAFGARVEVERFAAASDVIKASEEDIQWLYPGSDYQHVAQRWLESGALLVVVTRGADGAWCQDSTGRVVDVPGVRVNVIDTVGAGDSFMAALLFGLSERGLVGARGKARITGLDRNELAAVISQAVRASSVTCTRAGANPPTRAELLALAAAPTA